MFGFVLYLFLVLFSLFGLIYVYFQYAFTYWKRRNVPYVTPVFPFGNETDLLLQKKSMGEVLVDVYNKIKSPGIRFAGFFEFCRPVILIFDPDLIKDILVKDFDYFSSKPFYLDEENEPLTGNLVFVNGPKWKRARTKLTPTFTSGKIKMMFQTMIACSEGMKELLDGYVVTNKPIQIKEIFERFTSDIIGNSVFGVDSNSLKNPDDNLFKYGRMFSSSTNWQNIKVIVSSIYPGIFKFLRLKFASEVVSRFFFSLVREALEFRQNNNTKKKDFMQLLIELLKNEAGEEETEDDQYMNKPFTVEEITAHAAVFFIAGFDSSTALMSFVLYELAINESVQDKVRKEANEISEKYGNQFTYDAIQELKYLDKVVNETLRLMPVFPRAVRQCIKNYKIKDSDVVIEKGVTVFVPMQALHRDPDYFPDPLRFDPERFTLEETAKRHQYSYLPFGKGPRDCIGMRFARLQTKIAIAAVIKNYKVRLNSKTKTPLAFKSKIFTNSVKGGIWLNVEKVQ